MNLGKDHYHKREILSHEQCSSPPIPLIHFNLSQWLQQKISFAKKEGIRKVGEGGETGTHCSSSPLNKNALRENERRTIKHPSIQPSSFSFSPLLITIRGGNLAFEPERERQFRVSCLCFIIHFFYPPKPLKFETLETHTCTHTCTHLFQISKKHLGIRHNRRKKRIR